MRRCHTSAVVFAFGGNALAHARRSTSCSGPAARVCSAAVSSGSSSGAISCFIVMAATGYLLGITQGREYAEPEWYVDLWLTIVWVAYLVVFLGTILKRKEPHIYVGELVLSRHSS